MPVNFFAPYFEKNNNLFTARSEIGVILLLAVEIGEPRKGRLRNGRLPIYIRGDCL